MLSGWEESDYASAIAPLLRVVTWISYNLRNDRCDHF